MLPPMRTTLDIDEDVLQAAKELAAATGKTAGQVVSALIRKGLQAPSSTRRASRNGVPIVRRKPGAAVMTMTLVNELRDEM